MPNSMTDSILKKEIFPADYTKEQCQEIEQKWLDAAASFHGKIIALDDDPTGVQCVHDVSVYTDWSENSIHQGFQENQKLFFLLTNSRAFSKEKTTRVHQEIAERICQESKKEQMPFLLLSRGDSTLRGHYPLETDILRNEIEKEMGYRIDAEILCPYFSEGGRFTINDIHYVQDHEKLTPCGQTEFAKDETFGYASSDLKDYIEEKTEGSYREEDVISIPLSLLREQNYEEIESILRNAMVHARMIVNACDDHDVMVFITAMYHVMAEGKHFLARCAAPFVRVAAGISSKPLLEGKDFHLADGRGGLIMVGSHTAKTTKQMEELKALDHIVFLEMNCETVLDDERKDEYIRSLAEKASDEIKKGITVCIYTSRIVIHRDSDTKEEALARSVRISDALQSIVRKLSVSPAWVIAKGGITSSDIGVKALGVRRALVLGQIEPGVPVWKTDSTSLFPSIPYIIFPGNVGTEQTLKAAVSKLLH